MPARLPAFVIGYHGCDKAVGDAIVAGTQQMRRSENRYDWLGGGYYFWEGSPRRALDFARELAARPRKGKTRITAPAVIGAVLDLGHCLNLLDHGFLELVRNHHDFLRETSEMQGVAMPSNVNVPGNTDLLLRHLDCAVIELIHARRTTKGDAPFDSVRAVFVEGEALYPNAGFHAKTHLQICMRNPACIRGFFHPRDDEDA